MMMKATNSNINLEISKNRNACFRLKDKQKYLSPALKLNKKTDDLNVFDMHQSIAGHRRGLTLTPSLYIYFNTIIVLLSIFSLSSLLITLHFVHQRPGARLAGRTRDV